MIDISNTFIVVNKLKNPLIRLLLSVTLYYMYFGQANNRMNVDCDYMVKQYFS